jgi:hypothetical protein
MQKHIAISAKMAVLAVGIVFIVSGCSVPTSGTSNSGGKALSAEEAKTVAEKFINENLMPQDKKAVVNVSGEENGLYKIAVDAGAEKPYDWFMTKDGSKFFPQVIDQASIDSQKKEQDDQANQQAEAAKKQLENMKKTDKPAVELFVMSHCPYGTQAEKGAIPVAELLKDKVDFKIKFCDYAMHGEKEIKEQLMQHCLQKSDQQKYLSYLKCFLADESKSDECLKEAGVEKKSLESCISSTDKQFNVTKNFENKDGWLSGRYPVFEIDQADAKKYDVSGSPTLVVNGTKVSAGRDSQSMLDAVCAAFSSKPAECDQKLSSAAPSAGFGYGESDGSAAGGCAN